MQEKRVDEAVDVQACVFNAARRAPACAARAERALLRLGVGP